MAVSNEFLTYILDLYRDWGNVSARKMFGGAGLYHEDKMFGLIADDVVYLKVDDSNRADYEVFGSGPFKPFEHKPMTMPYYEIPADLLEDPDQLIAWSEKSLAIPASKMKQ